MSALIEELHKCAGDRNTVARIGRAWYFVIAGEVKALVLFCPYCGVKL